MQRRGHERRLAAASPSFLQCHTFQLKGPFTGPLMGMRVKGHIPTCPGIASGSCTAETSPVHPHSREESCVSVKDTSCTVGSSPLARGKRAVPCSRSGKCGSSPLARGKHICKGLIQGTPRFIPTRAGKAVGRSSTQSNPSVHPHSRGESGRRDSRVCASFGSSPLARGKPYPYSRQRQICPCLGAGRGREALRTHRPHDSSSRYQIKR